MMITGAAFGSHRFFCRGGERRFRFKVFKVFKDFKVFKVVKVVKDIKDFFRIFAE